MIGGMGLVGPTKDTFAQGSGQAPFEKCRGVLQRRIPLPSSRKAVICRSS